MLLSTRGAVLYCSVVPTGTLTIPLLICPLSKESNATVMPNTALPNPTTTTFLLYIMEKMVYENTARLTPAIGTACHQYEVCCWMHLLS